MDDICADRSIEDAFKQLEKRRRRNSIYRRSKIEQQRIRVHDADALDIAESILVSEGLSLSESRVVCLALQHKYITYSEIEDLTGMSVPEVTETVFSAQSRGYIENRTCDELDCCYIVLAMRPSDLLQELQDSIREHIRIVDEFRQMLSVTQKPRPDSNKLRAPMPDTNL